MYMRGRYIEYDNVEDFISHKLARLMHDMQKAQRHDIVQVLRDALRAYEDGEIEVRFVDGWPHVVYDTNVEESDTMD